MQIDEETGKEILGLWLQGFSFSQIADETGLTKRQVLDEVAEMRKRGIRIREAKKPVTIMDLRYSSCRYITGHDEALGALYCGEAVAKRSYCKVHFAICYYPSEK